MIDNSRKAVYGYDQRVEVFGSKGQVHVQNQFPNSAEVSTSEDCIEISRNIFFLERYKESYIREEAAFIEMVRSGGIAPVSGDDAYQAEKIAMAAKKSLTEQRIVKLSEIAE